jgi:hypothetical protein
MRFANLVCMLMPSAVIGQGFLRKQSSQHEPSENAPLQIDPMDAGLDENNERALAVTPKPTRRPTAKTLIPPIAPGAVYRAFVTPLTFQPGNFSKGAVSTDKRVKLSNGLSAKPIAQSGEFLALGGGVKSTSRFHRLPDAAGVFSKRNGGWYYVSNAESPTAGRNWTDGGVGSIEFNSYGKIVNYTRVATTTRHNCGGGVTPWNSWVSGEEITDGGLWQIDPRGIRAEARTGLGSLGKYESFAFDTSTAIPTFYATRDFKNGVLTRFTPNAQGMECYKKTADLDRWCTLDYGTLDFLLISRDASGTFQWTKNQTKAQLNAEKYYPNAEGIDVVDSTLFFTAKLLKRLVILDLKKMTYTYSSTVSGLFKEQPDQVRRIVPNKDSVLYFCEDVSYRSSYSCCFGGRLHAGSPTKMPLISISRAA